MRCSLSLLPVSTSSCKLVKVNSFPLQAGNSVWDNASICLIIQEFTVTWVVSCLKEYSCKIKDLNNFLKILVAFKGLMRHCHLLKFKKWEKCNFVCYNSFCWCFFKHCDTTLLANELNKIIWLACGRVSNELDLANWVFKENHLQSSKVQLALMKSVELIITISFLQLCLRN